MTYTGDGMLATLKDANSNVTSYQYDGQDRLATVTFADSTTNKYAYDSKGNVTTVTDGRGNVDDLQLRCAESRDRHDRRPWQCHDLRV